MYKIKDSCSGCHYCELACLMGAPYYDGYVYQIDADKCVECGLCERLCPTCSIYDAGSISTPLPHDKVVRECDLVVCGGGSGLIAAVKAAQMGKKVILLEKAKRVGGNMDYAHGFFPVYSKLHEEGGCEDMREDAVRDLSARTGGVVDKDIMRTAIYGCSEFVDWLIEFPDVREHMPLEKVGEKRSQGPVYGPAILGFPKRIENKLSRDPSIGPGWMGTLVKRRMLEAIPQQKLDVEILLEHAASKLITDESGKVTGVIAKDPGGETEIHCKAVILQTGGFGASDEKLQKYFNFFDVERPITRFTVPSNTGDAMDMVAPFGSTPNPERMNVSQFGPAHHPFSYALYRIMDHPSSVSINLNGKRWFDESGGLHAGWPKIKECPRQVAWAVYSQKNIDDIANQYLNDPTLADERNCYECYQEDLDKEAAYIKPPVMKADTLEELAIKLGINPAVFTKTFTDYNEFCKKGVDEEFGKDAQHMVPRENGPFYAVYGQLFSECSAGGIMVDPQCRVLRDDGTVIEGLYAGGDATSAMHMRDKLAVVSELTWAVTSAYRSAVNAVTEMEAE